MDFSSILKNFEPLWDNWKVEEQIGQGSMSKVFKISRKEFGKEYASALKLITIPTDIQISQLKKLNVHNSPEYSVKYIHNIVKKVINEVETLHEFKGHSNILSYEDHMVKKISETKWLIFVRMELANPVNKYTFNNSLTSEKVIQLGLDICNALETCHNKNILHGDVTENNIFVSNNGTFKLGDFNFSREYSNSEIQRIKSDKLNNIPPEILAGSSYTETSDIYSLGIIMYKLLNNGKNPLDSNDDFFNKSSNTKLNSPTNSNKKLSNIVLKACSFDPNERYQTIKEFKDSLLNLTNNNQSFVDNSNNKEVISQQDNHTTQQKNQTIDSNELRSVINEVEKKSKNNLMFILIIFFLVVLIGITLLDVVKEFFE